MKLPSLLPAVAVFSHLNGAVLAASCINTAFALVPTCAQSCILSGAPSVGCGGTDFECQCQKTAALFAVVDSCVSLSCPADSYQAVIDGVDLGEFDKGSSHSSSQKCHITYNSMMSTVCECIAPVILRRQGGTASVSGTVGTVVGTVTTSNTATATGTIASTTATTVSGSGTATSSAAGATKTSSEGGQGNGATWTGYTSVSSVASASAVGAAARPTLGANVARYVIPVAMAGAALL